MILWSVGGFISIYTAFFMSYTLWVKGVIFLGVNSGAYLSLPNMLAILTCMGKALGLKLV